MKIERRGRPRKYSSLQIRQAFIKAEGNRYEMAKILGTKYESLRKLIILRGLEETFPSVKSYSRKKK